MQRYIAFALFAATIGAIPGAAVSASLDVDGACILGNCTNPSVQPFGTSSVEPFTDTFTVNGDPFKIEGNSYSTINSSGSLTYEAFAVIYEGKSNTAQSDTISIVSQHPIEVPSAPYEGGFYDDGFFVVATYGANSSYTQKLTIDGTSITLGPYYNLPPYYYSIGKTFASTTIDNPTDITIDHTLVFGSGAHPGDQIDVDRGLLTVPEPGEWVLAVFGLASVGVALRSRRESRKKAPTLTFVSREFGGTSLAASDT